MISRRNQWFIAAVLLAGWLAYYGMADDGAPDPNSAASPAVAAQPPAAAAGAQPTVQPPPETEAGRILVAYRDAEGI